MAEQTPLLSSGHKNSFSPPTSPRLGFSSLWRSRRTPSRLVDRHSSFRQSLGILRLRRHVPSAALALEATDWYHNLLKLSTSYLVLLMFLVYALVLLVFAGLFMAASRHCGLEVKSLHDAFMLSVETFATIGFGVPDPYFKQCLGGPFLLYAVTAVSLLFDAIVIGLFFARFSRGTVRAATVLFSDKAVIRNVRGRWYFMLQVCDLRHKSLVEAHVRLYTVRRTSRRTSPAVPSSAYLVYSDEGSMNETPLAPVALQTYSMRLQHPNDELGGMLLLNMPNTIVHRIDSWSPLLPPASHARVDTSIQEGGAVERNTAAKPGLLLREVDEEVGNREAGPVPGRSKLPPQADLEAYLRGQHVEVIAIVEGIDAETSCTIQARHSYTLQDIEFNKGFVPCLTVSQQGTYDLDLYRFHTLEDAPPCNEDPFLPTVF